MALGVVGVEVAESGTRLTATTGTARDARRWTARLPEPPRPAAALDALHALIARALAEGAQAEGAGGPRAAVGVALAGAVDAAPGVVLALGLAPGWEGFPLAAALAERWGGPAAVETTTRAAALAEARLGAGRDHASVLYLALGRGVSAGLLLDGRIYRGARGRAGDLAHWLVRPDGPRCSCGARGHLEPIASAQALVRTMIGRAVDHPASEAAMQRISGGRAEAMTAPQVARLAAEGDPVAAGVVGEAVEALAAALANLVTALDPDVVVLGGPLAASAAFLGPLGERLAALCRPFGAAPPLLPGALEPDPALVGAVVGAAELRDRAPT